MDEQQYRNTYNSINPQQCVFEKAINSRVCNCNRSQRFNLADREGVACKSEVSHERCHKLLQSLHEKARFALQRLDIKQLGHAQEIKIQNGGLIGLQKELENVKEEKVLDIDTVVDKAENHYGSIEKFPYSQIMQVVNAYKIRAKKSKRGKL